MKNKNFVSLVVYLHNDTNYIEKFITLVSSVIDNNFELSEFIFIDDGSTDDTYEKTIKIIESMKINAFVVSLSYRHNKDFALLAGTDKSIGDFVYQFESVVVDYNPNLIIKMFDKIKAINLDIVSIRSDTQSKRQAIYNYLFNLLSSSDSNIAEERAILSSRKALNALSDINERLRSNKALTGLLGLNVHNMVYIPINAEYSDNRSNVHLFRLFFIKIISYTNIGASLSFLTSTFFFLCSMYFSVKVVFLIFTTNELVNNWHIFMLFISIAFSLMFLVIGFLSSSVIKILRETINYPVYNIEKTFKFFKP
jgi:dolichol-phosphate mannosyltransferase